MNEHKILIIDDDAANLECLTEILGEYYTVYNSKISKGGIVMAMNIQPEVIFLDINLPNTDGYETLSTLKNLESTKEITVFIALDLYTTDLTTKELIAKADGFIHKPINRETVLEKVRKYFITKGSKV